MIELLAILLTLQVTAFASDFHEIDPVATASKSWEIGEVVYKGNCTLFSEKVCVRVFLGVTEKGFYILQEYYETGEKRTDPYISYSTQEKISVATSDVRFLVDGPLIKWHENGAKKEEAYYNIGKVHGCVTSWYESGQIGGEVCYKNGRDHGHWTWWHENGQKAAEREYDNGRPVGIWRNWDSEGVLFREMNLDTSGK